MPPKKYTDFLESEPIQRRGKLPPHAPSNYIDVTCPHCKTTIEILQTHIKAVKASQCLAHLRKCPAYNGPPLTDAPEKKRKRDTQEPTEAQPLVTIYKLVYLPENRAVYTGRTKDPKKRLQQHASANSACRLVRNAIRRHGRSKFAIEPIMRCMPADADANESYYIMANNTMHPNGYNLRHGAAAGLEPEGDMRVSVAAAGLVPFEGVADEFRAQADAMNDLAELCENLEDCSGTEEVCRNLLREVHPDQAGDRSYSAAEVSAMLNAVRESVRGN